MDLILILCLNETMDQLALANSEYWSVKDVGWVCLDYDAVV